MSVSEGDPGSAADAQPERAAPNGRLVSDDGSPVAVYLALPAGEIPRLIDRVTPVDGSILELGCGAGRITRPLVAMGYAVVAVDDSPAMLEHVTGAETVCADVYELNLERTFDTVVAGSYFINRPGREGRRALLRACRRHVTDGGAVLVQRHDPDWLAHPLDSEGTSGPVDINFRVLDQRGGELHASITYKIGAQSWTQTFTAVPVSDGDLADDAATAGLVVDSWLERTRSWALLRPAR